MIPDLMILKRKGKMEPGLRYVIISNKNLDRGGEKGPIVDVAAGYCDFINHYHCPAKSQKFAIDVNPDVEKFAASDVTAICGGIGQLSKHFRENSVSLFFMSNFLEHITKDQIKDLLNTEYWLLQSGGKVMILTPNIKYVGGKYWDFFDHITPITEKCLIEEAETIGFHTSACISKFLPFTTKSRLPQAQWIVRCYLRLMPVSGHFFGEQSLLIFTK